MPHPHHKKIIDIASTIILLALIMLDAVLWRNIFVARGDTGGVAAAGGAVGSATAPRIYFLPVTQGESALLVLPGGATVLTDAGSDGSIVDDLQKVLPPGAPSYIDLAIISYPQTADYEGYEYLLQHYQVGAFLYNGRADVAHRTEWNQLTAAIVAKHIPLITLGAGDSIRFGNTDIGAARGTGSAIAEIDILSPGTAFARSPEPSDTAIVQRVVTQKFTALLAADIGVNVEDALLAHVRQGPGASTNSSMSLRANILKAPLPGLGTAAGDAFLQAVAPQTIVITPGVKNTASAPTKAILAYLASSTALFPKAAVISSKTGVFLLYNK
jgi:beta-lactamase superfamily II metal-dependent hydrolase